VVVLEELPRENAERLFGLLPSLPHRFHAAGLSAGGLAILSRTPMKDTTVVTRDGLTIAARTDIDLGDRSLRFYGIHLFWPLVPASARIRDAQLAALARELRECAGACLAAGDFNTTPWSSHFRDLLSVSGFKDCAQGQGWVPTWPATLPALLRIRIDQCLARQLGVSMVSVGRGEGSDHLATINDLYMPR
jgi:endonuclease/exonuclease/phosphatase (EEP) superfamily protein YafD